MLGIIDEVIICIGDVRMIIPMQVVGSEQKTVLLENDWMQKYKVDIIGSKRKI